ncbi:hypothetical protein C8F01DRAFT_1161972 [Mycena amicta]|nr:hypothetical protein C8F01DRAFT_1161972 [Mycena amicta]
MHFQLASVAALLSFLTGTLAQAGSCPEAARFGNLKVSPSTLSPGQKFTVTADLTCAVQLGNTPTYLDYYISGTARHTISGPILIARRTYNATTTPPVDKFTAVLPSWFYFADATYSLRMDNSFARLGPTGQKVITTGGIFEPVNITGF